MTQTLKRISILAASVASIVALFMTSMPLMAQEQAGSGSGLRISPTRTDISVVPGDSRDITQTVKNVTQNPVTVEPVLTDFESNGTTGEPRLIGREGEVSAYSLREFISLPEPFDLQPDEEREFTLNVSVPEGSSPGGYFGSIVYRATPVGPSGGGQVALVASVGSLVLLEVPGDIVEQIQINDISAFINDNKGSFFTKKPTSIGVEIENLGNSFSQPFGKVVVKDWRGNETFVYELNNSTPRGNILPDSIRLFQNELFDVEVKNVNGVEEVEKTSPLKWPGRYTITGNISHGSSGEIFTVSSSFWYIPLWLIIAGAVLILVLILGSVGMYKKYVTKSTNRKK